MVKLPFDKPKKRKKTPLGKLKKIAWKTFSLWIRKRGSPDGEHNTCVTCGAFKKITELHASHFIPSRRNSILFLEENCHPGCYVCNIMRHGALEDYYPFMLARYGQETIDRIKRLKNEIFKPTREYYEALIEKYQTEE